MPHVIGSIPLPSRPRYAFSHGSYYYSHYTELCLAISQRCKNHRNNPFSQEADGKQLHNTLTEYPPPSFSEVVRRLGHTREFVRRKFPELSKAIVTRYTHYQAALRNEMSVRLRHAIRVAAQQIIASGEYVSVNLKLSKLEASHCRKCGMEAKGCRKFEFKLASHLIETVGPNSNNIFFVRWMSACPSVSRHRRKPGYQAIRDYSTSVVCGHAPFPKIHTWQTILNHRSESDQLNLMDTIRAI